MTAFQPPADEGTGWKACSTALYFEMNITVLTYDTLGSTNTEALSQARSGAEEGLCVIARQQTAGRGRRGRTWISPKDSGLYFSIVLRPRIDIQFLPLITLMSGIAVHDSLAGLGLDPDIKWVNDILVGEKKIAGILAETTDTHKGQAVVVGIGINIRSTNFPPELGNTATSVHDESSDSSADLREQVLEDLTKQIVHFYGLLNSAAGPAAVIDEWRRRSTYFTGKPVRVSVENETFAGTTDGLESNGALRVKRDNGSITIVQAGDVEQLRAIAGQ